jgi:DNA mismatch repair protein MutL
VHPAKTQVRFRDSVNLFSVVHKTVKQALSALSAETSFSAKSQATSSTRSQTDFDFPQSTEKTYANDISANRLQETARTVLEEAASYQSSSTRTDEPFVFLGSWDSLFLLVLKKGELYLIDQHAAHERVLFDQYSSRKHQSQKLLFAAELKDLEQNRLDFYAEHSADLKTAGFVYKIESGTFILTEIPDMLGGSVAGILDLIMTGETDVHKWKAKAFAVMACRAAIKDGDRIDTMSAVDLIDKAFALPIPRCPHGRPVWIKITREEAFERIGRKI